MKRHCRAEADGDEPRPSVDAPRVGLVDEHDLMTITAADFPEIDESQLIVA